MRVLALAAVLVACASTERVVVPADGQTPPPRSSWSTPPTCPKTEIAALESLRKTIPAGLAPDRVFRGVAQFATAAGLSIRSIDHLARTVETEPFAGQTIALGCNNNEYRVYVVKIAVSDGLIMATLDCYRSLGWEPHVRNGVQMGKYRSATEECPYPAYVSAGDAGILSDLVGGALDVAGFDGAE